MKYIELTEEGDVHEVDLETGAVEKVKLSPEDLLQYRPERTADGKLRWVHETQVHRTRSYSPIIAETFAYCILDGKGIRGACEEVGITYYTYCQWRKRYAQFKDLVDEARRDRGEQFFDKMEAIVENTSADEDEIALSRLKTDTYKHLAAVSDSRRFNPSTKIDATVAVARVIVDTGIRRAGEEATESLRDIEESQAKLAQSEVLQGPRTVGKPIGVPLSEEELDGKAPKEEK